MNETAARIKKGAYCSLSARRSRSPLDNLSQPSIGSSTDPSWRRCSSINSPSCASLKADRSSTAVSRGEGILRVSWKHCLCFCSCKSQVENMMRAIVLKPQGLEVDCHLRHRCVRYDLAGRYWVRRGGCVLTLESGLSVCTQPTCSPCRMMITTQLSRPLASGRCRILETIG